MARIRKAFICNDLDKDTSWPEDRYPLMSERMFNYINSRQTYKLKIFKDLELKNDKKTNQWWSKFTNDKSFRSFHFYLHHQMRQILDYVNKNPDTKKSIDSWMLLVFNNQTNECKWKPND